MKYKVIAIMMLLPIQALWAAFSGSGSGTSGDPYLVTSASQLDEVRNDLTAYYKQTIDIDISSYSNWSRIGTSTTAGTNFTGSYDGDGHKITGLTITSTTATGNGVFGVIGSGGTVKNLGVSGSVSGSNHWLGLLVGYNYGGTIDNCYSTGTVTTSANVAGGLIGFSSGNVTNSYSTASVTATGTGSTNIGGLIGAGTATTGSISQCYSTGNVSNNSTTGSVNTGGFIGLSPHPISNCYSTGNVSSSSGGRAGGFVGGTGTTSSSSFTNCYSTGLVTCTTKGGFVGYFNAGSFSNCFFDYNTASTSSTYGTYVTSAPTGITAKTTSEMKTQSTFTGWDFTSIWEIISGFYPRLKSNPDPALPIELTSFTALSVGNNVILNWQTATEVNNYGFEVERRAVKSERSPKDNWQKIGFVSGAGTSNAPKEYSYSDATVYSGKYVYRLKQIDQDGTFEYSQLIEVSKQLPEQITLNQNYPNPFNPSTTIAYQLQSENHVTLKVFDVLGKEVETLVNEVQQPGNKSVTFDASALASGIYFYRLQSGSFSQTHKLLLLK
jgi:hypothetical protein